MNHYNKVIVQGNLTRDVEVKYTSSSTAVANMTIATNRKFRDREPEVCFVDVTAWGKLAEVVGEYAKKGMCLLIDGRLTQESWEDKESGKKRSKLVIVANEIHLPPRSKSDDAGHDSTNDNEPF